MENALYGVAPARTVAGMRDVVDYVDKILFSHKSIGKWRKESLPRQARLDAPGTLHHVILRGLRREGSRISLVKGRS